MEIRAFKSQPLRLRKSAPEIAAISGPRRNPQLQSQGSQDFGALTHCDAECDVQEKSQGGRTVYMMESYSYVHFWAF